MSYKSIKKIFVKKISHIRVSFHFFGLVNKGESDEKSIVSIIGNVCEIIRIILAIRDLFI